MTTPKIDTMIEELIGREGRYSNNPSDKGGETMWGITVAVARAYGYVGAMAQMPRDAAKEIYFRQYFVEPNFFRVSEISAPIAEELFDTGVNQGTAIPGKFLQRALNVLNQQGKSWPEVGVDGRIGPQTLFALQQYLSQRAAPGETVMLRLLNAQQAVRYIEIAERDSTQEVFEFGWIQQRVGSL